MIKDNLKILTSNGQEIICDIIAMFNKNDKNYIIYTDETLASDGKYDTLAARYTREGDNLKLEEIETEEEWKIVEAFLQEKVLTEDDDF